MNEQEQQTSTPKPIGPRQFTITATYTPSAIDAWRLNVPDMRSFARTALEHIFEADRLTDIKVEEVER